MVLVVEEEKLWTSGSILYFVYLCARDEISRSEYCPREIETIGQVPGEWFEPFLDRSIDKLMAVSFVPSNQSEWRVYEFHTGFLYYVDESVRASAAAQPIAILSLASLWQIAL